MFVTKRSRFSQTFVPAKLMRRLALLMPGLSAEHVSISRIIHTVERSISPGITTDALDTLVAETAAFMSNEHPDYGLLAGRVVASRVQGDTEPTFCDVAKELASQGLITEDVLNFALAHREQIEEKIVCSRDYNFDFFAMRTLTRSYLLRVGERVVETPQCMFMRVAIAVHLGDIERVLESYDLMSRGFFTHATPTLFNAGTTTPTLSSCFLLQVKHDSIEGIFDTLKQTALISKGAGGIGLAVHNVRAAGARISRMGTSMGLVPMLRMFNNAARFVNQGNGRRKGACAVYIEPWHADVFEVLQLRKNNGVEELRARDLFYGLWTPDLFMRRVQQGALWSLMCPATCPGLHLLHGAAFDELYERYEREGRFTRQVPARELWEAIIGSQVETGGPYLLFKDACNAKSNQSHNGTIQCSNLCTEVVQYTSPDLVAVCNLASIALNKFVTDKVFDFDLLHRVVQVVTRNLNRVIDTSAYAVPEAQASNERERPIGIGVQGLADAFALMSIAFDSAAARELNAHIFETMYHAAVTASIALAREHGAAYPNFEGSAMQRGKLQFDLWGVTPAYYDWSDVREQLREHGIYNSLLIAPMPTASTSQILGNNESIEPFTSNMYVRRTLAGDFQVVNKHLVRDLLECGLWTPVVRARIMASNGSIQGIRQIPQRLRDVYKTAFEIDPRVIVDLAADRGAFVCQSQSLNIFINDVSFNSLHTHHMYAWKRGLKTGMYYLRSNGASDPTKFTVDPSLLLTAVPESEALDSDAPESEAPESEAPESEAADDEARGREARGREAAESEPTPDPRSTSAFGACSESCEMCSS